MIEIFKIQDYRFWGPENVLYVKTVTTRVNTVGKLIVICLRICAWKILISWLIFSKHAYKEKPFVSVSNNIFTNVDKNFLFVVFYKSENARYIYHISISIPTRIGFTFRNDKKAYHKESIQIITTSFVLNVVDQKEDLL